MGRRTLDSFPGGKPLPNRRNIVITRNPDFQRDGVEVVSDPEDCRALISQLPQEKVWVIGGGSVYTALLPQCHRAYVTRVDAAVGDADTFFPNLDKSPDWEAGLGVRARHRKWFHLPFCGVYQRNRLIYCAKAARRRNSAGFCVLFSQRNPRRHLSAKGALFFSCLSFIIEQTYP